jgi:hypothetical protein
VITIEYIQSEKNVADILTKGIFGRDFVYKRQKLLGLQVGEAEVQEATRPPAKSGLDIKRSIDIDELI